MANLWHLTGNALSAQRLDISDLAGEVGEAERTTCRHFLELDMLFLQGAASDAEGTLYNLQSPPGQVLQLIVL